MTNQPELTTLFCSKPQQFAWFLGAGTSAVAGLPTASDIIWDLKRRHYCREENQEITRQDIQIDAVRSRIQSYMLSKGFPNDGDPSEYTTYFEKIFQENKERQRKYLSAILSEDKVTLSIGNRILGALLATGKTRAVFTTNFDSVVERAMAEVKGRSLSAYHLEGAASANKAISNEEFPFYCKLHGDFRYDSIKNLPTDLAVQNEELSKSLLNAANRFGFIVAGYSGRDESVMQLLRSALSTPNPFPHGLFWTGMRNAKILPAVMQLLEEARRVGVDADFIEIETFDSFMLRLWRSLDDKDPAVNAKVYKSHQTEVNIPLPDFGKGSIIRMNALPIISVPTECQSLSFKNPKEWTDLRAITNATEGRLIFTKSDTILCWGSEALVRSQFSDLTSISRHDLSQQITDIENYLYIKGFLEEAVCRALSFGKSLITRNIRANSYLIADPHNQDQSAFDALRAVVGETSGQIAGLFAPIDEDHPHPEKISWAEAIRLSIEFVDGKAWLLIDPDIWIWPKRARQSAATFLEERRGNRFNNIYNALIDAWLSVLFGGHDRNTEIVFSAGSGTNVEVPSFRIGTRTAYTRGLA